ncbi:hypothetical protein HII12_002831 [Brettanomyces bruxellensis]|uniref:DNA-directed RNA polymerase III subunit RPC6 n=1 Tax=Dekkera bruxellensis TaxID=5007 RepID=A0A8H6BF33_DEKBR|nr:hypothetical protein HII12_002831 [Brettanomyces bruxellensis]
MASTVMVGSPSLVSDGAKLMHEKMIEGKQASYSQQELMKIMKFKSSQELMKLAQELLNHGLLKIMETVKKDSKEKGIVFAPISEQEAQKVSGMSNDEAMVYSYIEAAGREGIWTKTLKVKTNLHQHVVLRCLKSLESQSYIKAVKSVKHPQRKIYMLYHLTPSIEVTGGPWFTDSELDTDFIDSLLIIVWKFVASKTFPMCFKGKGTIVGGHKQLSYPASMLSGMGGQLPTLARIGQFIASSGVTTVELTLDNVKSLCDVLVYDEKLEVVNAHCYKATWQSVLEAGGGKIEGVDIYQPQNDEIFNIDDSYRTMDTANVSVDDVTGKDDHKNNSSSQTHFYLDSWYRI